MHGDMTWLYAALLLANPWAWFIALNVVDVLLTLYVIKHGGSEKNPILARWFTLDDPDVVLVRVKVALLCAVWLMHYFGALPEWAMWALIIGYCALAGHNINQAMKTWERTHP